MSLSDIKPTLENKIQIMTGLNGGQLSPFLAIPPVFNAGRKQSMDSLATPDSVAEEERESSAEKQQRVFSDFTIDFDGQKDVRQNKLDEAGHAYDGDHCGAEGRDDKGALLDHARTQGLAMMKAGRDRQKQKLYNIRIGGVNYKFTNQDLDKTIDEIQSDPYAFQYKHHLTDNQLSDALVLASLLEDATDEEREIILKEWDKKNPEATHAFAKEVEHQHTEEFVHGHKEETPQELSKLDKMEADLLKNSTAHTNLSITEPFMEASNEPLALKEAPEIQVAENAQDAFSLDG